jgi:hypothetical protein
MSNKPESSDPLIPFKSLASAHDPFKEIAALKAERDRLVIIADAIQAERDRLRAALEEINRPFDQTMTGLETANLLRAIARRALEWTTL